MKNKIFKFYAIILAILSLASRCKEPEPIPPRGDYDGGYLILNEGQFMHDNASVSFIKKDFSGTEDSIYYKVNNELLGDVAQSVFTTDDKAYFLINNSDRIIVAHRWKMKKKGIISSYIIKPRYMERISTRYAVVSNWGELFDANWQDVDDDFLAWVDLENDVVVDTLHVETGPERMLYHGGKLYVLVPGVNTSHNKVLIIDPAGHSKIGEITVGDRPSAIVSDSHDNLWVLCSGNAAWTGNETAGKLIRINPVTDNVVESIDLGTTNHPRLMAIKDDNLYIIYGTGLYKISIQSPVFDASRMVLDLNGIVQNPYGMKIIDDKLFIMDAVDYVSPGKVFVFDMNTLNQIGEFRTGYLPNDVAQNF